jgi:ribokinase
MMSLRVCVLGSLNMDLVFTAERFARPGETVIGNSFAAHPGGKGANQAVAAARAGVEVALIGALGADEHARELRRVLQAEGVDHSHVARRANVPTGVASILVDGRGENQIVVVPGANGKVEIEDLERAEEVLAGARLLVCQLELPLAIVDRGLVLARRRGVPTLLNAAPAAELTPEIWRSVDWLVVNEREAQRTAGAAGAPEVQLARLLDRGPRRVVITLGARGALAGERGATPRRISPFAVEVVDTVGAGDAFVGSLAASWVRGDDFDACLQSASAAGALACTRRGAIASLPTRAEVEALLERSRP